MLTMQTRSHWSHKHENVVTALKRLQVLQQRQFRSAPASRRAHRHLRDPSAGAGGAAARWEDSGDGSSSGQAEPDIFALGKKMLTFMAPALIIPLGDPLMTLTDTIFIGQCAGTRELAAMGPANLIFNFSQYIFQSLQIAAISLISDDLRKGLLERAEHRFRVALSLAMLSGLIVMGLMEVGAETLISCTGADPALVPLAVPYMRIRAFAQPAVLLTMVCQGGLLAQQDSRTPALAVLLSVTVNIAANFVAVAWLGLGLKGAAATTVATQVVGVSLLLLVASRSSALTPALTASISVADLKAFAHTMGPLSVTYVCKNLCYILLQTAAASLSWVQLAAHQAVFSVWNLLAFTTAPLEQAALAYIPAAATRWQQRSTVQLLLAISCCIGITCGLLAAGVPLLAPQLLTKDPAVWPYMAGVAPLALVAMLLTAADVGAAGILLARRELAYLARAYLVTLAMLGVYVVLGVHGCSWGLQGVWAGLVLFFGLRCAQSMARLLYLGIDGVGVQRMQRPATGS